MTQRQLKLGELIRQRYQHRMEGDPELEGETLLVRFDSGLTLEVEPADESDFTFSWAWSSPDWGLETNNLGWQYTLNQDGDYDGTSSEVRGRITEPTRANWPALRDVLDAMFKDSPQLRLNPR